ncbi:angiopoietin-1-like [Saccostrea echinata]|uniref:angiopoietin-1-like n=1 Tax=Saccostrea echinata TaxID=191078 RepID=UPI002A83C0CD|nr:angiopoietin-1-like [Saccostrea echinata]
MAMMWKYIFVSGLLFTSSQYLNLGEKDECDSNENIMEKLQTLVNQQSKLQHEIDRLKNDKEELRVLLTNCSSTNDQTRSLDCSDIYNSGQTKTGVYKIYPFGENNRAVSVICEMDSPGGGCTVKDSNSGIQKA